MIQFVWWGFGRATWGLWRPEAESGYARIYAWALRCGPFEVRRWV